jgi:flagellar protein FliS
MFGSSQMKGANAYAKVGIETGVIAASPHKLIVMLFDGAIVSIGNAIQHLKAGEIAAKGKSISKTVSIIDNGLRASLDKKVGGEIAVNLDALYAYMSNRLILGNLHNKEEYLLEVQTLLRDLKSSWETISPENTVATAVSTKSNDPLAPRSANYVEA